MDLITPRQKDKVFLFDGSVKDQVWEARPVKRFRFKQPINDLLSKRLAKNYATAGIFFQGVPYIGTNDGFIATPDGEKQRIPNIHVDSEIFLDEYSFREGERKLFETFQDQGFSSIPSDEGLVRRILGIQNLVMQVNSQSRNLDFYTESYLGIRGFVVDGSFNVAQQPRLYDGHLLGITETIHDSPVNPLSVLIMHQVNPERAGFVPMFNNKTEINNGFVTQSSAPCVDHRSLWSLDGVRRIAKDLCPRDGSGYAPAKFVTDGNVIGISHGNHPFYRLDILSRESELQKEVKSIDLDPAKTPGRLFVSDGCVIGNYGNTVRNFSEDRDIFTPPNGRITSFSDLGNLCTVLMNESKSNETTMFYDVFTRKPVSSVDGDYVFLERAPQSY